MLPRLRFVAALALAFYFYSRVATLQRQNERVRRALSDHERDRASLDRIETKIDRLSKGS